MAESLSTPKKTEVDVIPKIIHHCWFSGDPVPALYRRCVESWKERLSGYDFVLWTRENTRIDTPFLEENLKNKKWAFVSDYVRMRAIHEMGGIYLDMDIELVRSLDPLLDYSCFIGEEAPSRPNPSVVGAEAGHPFPQACMEIIDRRFNQKKPYLIAPEVAMEALRDRRLAGQVSVLPSHYFYPYNPYDKTRETTQLMYADVRHDTYAVHHWAKSWNQSVFTRAMKKIFK